MSAQRWRSQSLIGHEFFTGKDSRAAEDGHMPAYAENAFRIATAGAAIAGLAKKRWRDGGDDRMTLERVRQLRAESDKAFAALEAGLECGGDTASAVLNPAKAEASFATFGRLGYLALANIEEAGELAQPLHALAIGSGDPATALRDAAEEAADVRVYLHVTSESLRINQTTSTDRKWAVVQARWPHIFAPRARQHVAPVDMKAAIAGLIRLETKDQTS